MQTDRYAAKHFWLLSVCGHFAASTVLLGPSRCCLRGSTTAASHHRLTRRNSAGPAFRLTPPQAAPARPRPFPVARSADSHCAHKHSRGIHSCSPARSESVLPAGGLSETQAALPKASRVKSRSGFTQAVHRLPPTAASRPSACGGAAARRREPATAQRRERSPAGSTGSALAGVCGFFCCLQRVFPC